MDALPAEAFRGAVLRLLMLETGEFEVTPALIRRSLLYTSMFSEAAEAAEAAGADPESKAKARAKEYEEEDENGGGPWAVLPIMSPEVLRPIYHAVNELSAGTMACYPSAPDQLDLATEWILRRNSLSRGIDAQNRPDSNTRRKLWQLDARFVVPPATNGSKAQVALQASHAISVLRVCGGEAILIRLLGPQRATADGATIYNGDMLAVDPGRHVLITSKRALARAIENNTISSLLRSAATCTQLTKAIVGDTLGNGACIQEWTNGTQSPSVFETASALAPHATSIRSALLSIGFGVRCVRERFVVNDAELRAFVEDNVRALASSNEKLTSKTSKTSKTSDAEDEEDEEDEEDADDAEDEALAKAKAKAKTKAKTKAKAKAKARKGNDSLGGASADRDDKLMKLHAITERDHKIAARNLIESLLEVLQSRNKTSKEKRKKRTWTVDMEKGEAGLHGHGLEGWVRGRYPVTAPDGQDDCIPEGSGGTLSLSAIVLDKCSDGIAMQGYVRAPDWMSFVEIAKASAHPLEYESPTTSATEEETIRSLLRWQSWIVKGSYSASASASAPASDAAMEARTLSETERDWIIVDEAVGNQRVLSISDHSAYRSNYGDQPADQSYAEHDPDILLELLGASALSMVHAESINRAAKVLFDTPPGGASLRRLNDVVAEIGKKRDALFQKFKTTSIETRLIRRAEEEAVDAILVERVQALHGALRVTQAWTSAVDAFITKSAQILFRARAVDPVRVPKADAMSRAVSAYAKRAAANPEVSRLLKGVTDIRISSPSSPSSPYTNSASASSAISSYRSYAKNNTNNIHTIHNIRKRSLNSNIDEEKPTEPTELIRHESTVMILPEEAGTETSSSETKESAAAYQESINKRLAVVEVTPATVSRAASSDANRKFLRDILANTSPSTHLSVRSYLLGDCVPFLYRIASNKSTSRNGPLTGIDREILRAGAVGRLHIASVAEALKHTVESSTDASASAKYFFYACVSLVSQHSLLTRMIAAELIDALRGRIEFNKTDAVSIKLEEEKISRLRSQQLF